MGALTFGFPEWLEATFRACTPIVRGKSPGTGFFVAPNLVITCRHVAGDGKVQVRLNGEEDNEALASPVALSKAADVALVRTRLTVSSFARLQSHGSLGESVVAYGWAGRGGDQHWDAVLGILEQLEHQHPFEPWRSGARLLKFKEGHIVGGFSGGPLIDARTGRAIGVVTTTRDPTSDLGGVAVPMAFLLEELQAVREAQQRDWSGTPWANLPPDPPVEVQSKPYALEELHRPHVNNLPPRMLAERFVGRSDIVQRIVSRLAMPRLSKMATAIHGIGGIGKTSVALEAAWNLVLQHRYRGAFFMTASSPLTLRTQFLGLARFLKVQSAHGERDEVQYERLLAALDADGSWLFVLDNADTYLSGPIRVPKLPMSRDGSSQPCLM